MNDEPEETTYIPPRDQCRNAIHPEHMAMELGNIAGLINATFNAVAGIYQSLGVTLDEDAVRETVTHYQRSHENRIRQEWGLPLIDVPEMPDLDWPSILK